MYKIVKNDRYWIVKVIDHYPFNVNLRGFKSVLDAEVALRAFEGDEVAAVEWLVRDFNWFISLGLDVDAALREAWLGIMRLGIRADALDM